MIARANEPRSARVAGRQRELAELEVVVNAASAGSGRFVVFSGEPGIGKTRLLSVAGELAREAEMVAAQAACYEDAAASPYAPFGDLLRDIVRQIPDVLDYVGRDDARRIVDALAPELGVATDRDSGRSSLTETEQRQGVFDAFGRLLARVATGRSFLVTLDDLHWLEEPGAMLLRHLARTLRASPVALVGAYRDTDLDPGHPFERVLVDLTRERVIRRIALRRLDTESTRDVVERLLETSPGMLSPLALDALQREAEGVPFFIEELVLHLREEGLLARGGTGRWELASDVMPLLPQSVRGVIGHRLSRLRAETREILSIAAVIGREFRLDVLSDVSATRGHAADVVADALDEAGARRLIREVDELGLTATGYTFAHEQIREVLYRGVNVIRRRSLHQQIGESIEQRMGASPRMAAVLAHHFMRGEDLAKAAGYAVVAADEAMRVHSAAEAARQYGEALEILELMSAAGHPEATATRRLEVMLARDDAWEAAGQETDREAAQLAALRLAEQVADDRLQRATLLRAARFNTRTGRLDSARAYARSALDRARQLAPAERLPALIACGESWTGRRLGEPSHLLRPVDDLIQAEELFTEAIAVAREQGDALWAARLAQELGVVAWAIDERRDGGESVRSRDLLVAALEGFRAIDDRKGELTALIALAYRRKVSPSTDAATVSDSYVSFLEEIRRLRATEHRLSRLSEQPRLEALALMSIHLYCRTTGWYEVALQRATQAHAVALAAREPRIAVLAGVGLSETEHHLGRHARALEHAEWSAALLDGTPELGGRSGGLRDAVSHALAAAHAFAGSRDQALALAYARVETAEQRGQASAVADALAGLAELYDVLGDRPSARETAERALRVAANLPGNISWDIRAEVVLGRQALAEGETRLALGHAMAANGRLAQRETPVVWIRTATALLRGRALLANGDDDDGRRAIEQAHALVARIAERMMDQSMREAFLRRCPLSREVIDVATRLGVATSRNHSTPAAGAHLPAILTRREAEVVRLVAAGSANREIADTLFISEKTVARHLTNIFTKIGVQSRTQAAAWAFRNGIV